MTSPKSCGSMSTREVGGDPGLPHELLAPRHVLHEPQEARDGLVHLRIGAAGHRCAAGAGPRDLALHMGADARRAAPACAPAASCRPICSRRRTSSPRMVRGVFRPWANAPARSRALRTRFSWRSSSLLMLSTSGATSSGKRLVMRRIWPVCTAFRSLTDRAQRTKAERELQARRTGRGPPRSGTSTRVTSQPKASRNSTTCAWSSGDREAEGRGALTRRRP